MLPVTFRLNAVSSSGLLTLPWAEPLETWGPPEVELHPFPAGQSRHVVRFVRVDGQVFAFKELPVRVARSEHQVLRAMQRAELPSVRPVGLVEQPDADRAVLVTEFLQHSWQYRRLFQRMPPGLTKYKERLFDALAILLVDLHRAGVFWGDCSLANTLFARDGQILQAFMVDAETSAVHATLSDGQRQHDLDIMVENVTGDLFDLSAKLGRDPGSEGEIEAAEAVVETYRQLWEELYRTETTRVGERFKVERRVRRLNDIGFVVDEVSLLPDGGGGRETLKLKVAVANRRYHAIELRSLTGLDVGEGQAEVLLNDLHAFGTELRRDRPVAVPSSLVAVRWLQEVLLPGAERARAALGGDVDPVQAYCDLIEVRWLLSEDAGRDVGDRAALEALAARRVPPESAARMVVAEASTGSFPAVDPSARPIGGGTPDR